MRSSFLKNEWEYALSLGRDGFVRPVYWQKPLPSDPPRNLPPAALRKLRFLHISSPVAGFLSSTLMLAPGDDDSADAMGPSDTISSAEADEVTEFDTAVSAEPRAETDQQRRDANPVDEDAQFSATIQPRATPTDADSWRSTADPRESQRSSVGPILRLVILISLAAAIWLALQFWW
jgi:hypothetical protein